MPGAGASMTNIRTSVSADVVSAPVSSTPIEVAERLCSERFGLKATARRLSSERDENFHLRAPDGQEFLLKITNAAEDRMVTDFQTRALEHVAGADESLPIPRLVRSLDGDLQVLFGVEGERSRVVRLMTFIQGSILHDAKRSAAQCRNLGSTLGRLDLALRDYVHRGSGHELRWDLKHAAALRPLLPEIVDAGRRALATLFLDNFEAYALPVLPSLRSQVIHNDFQPSNILVDANAAEEVVGIIDFGDMVEAPLINDVAVAGAYHLACPPEPLGYSVALVGAFNDVVPLMRNEVEILFDLMATRLVMTVTITNWRAARHPENSAYILRNASAAWRALERCATLPRGQAQSILGRACRLE
jgi:Ser/Thr protein kinase RdoA (MazF antagonist)